jgi:hypothetical protein
VGAIIVLSDTCHSPLPFMVRRGPAAVLLAWDQLCQYRLCLPSPGYFPYAISLHACVAAFSLGKLVFETLNGAASTSFAGHLPPSQMCPDPCVRMSRAANALQTCRVASARLKHGDMSGRREGGPPGSKVEAQLQMQQHQQLLQLH